MQVVRGRVHRTGGLIRTLRLPCSLAELEQEIENWEIRRTPREVQSLNSEAATLSQALSVAGPDAPELFRGMVVDAKDPILGNLQQGGEFT